MIRHRRGIAIIFYFLSTLCHAAEEIPNVAFLEWLGKVTEMEEMGVDINKLIQQLELDAKNDMSKENRQ